jgi:hypothetical protein
VERDALGQDLAQHSRGGVASVSVRHPQSKDPAASIGHTPRARKRHVLHVRSLALSLFDADLGANVWFAGH